MRLQLISLALLSWLVAPVLALDPQVIDDTLGSGKSLASEIWKVFVVLMGIALLVEAVLCMPPKVEPKTSLATDTETRRSAA
jgi:hypothetical protein